MRIYHIDDIYNQDMTDIKGDYVFAGARETRRGYLRDFCTFDTEWTTVSYTDDEGKEHGRGLLYLWTACIFGRVYEGRTLEEFVTLTRRLNGILGLNSKRVLVIYVHNLAADFSFMYSYFQDMEIFAMDKRAVIKASIPGIEFRCSYKLSNMSLAKFCQSEGTKHQKQSGEKFDYDKLRTPDTWLTVFERYYAACDVLGQYEAIKHKMEREGDTTASVPMTSTGYVRRDCRNKCAEDKTYRARYLDQKLTAKQYTILRDAFRGGNTHANRFYAGRRIKNVWSYDIASSYPAVMLYEKYPCGPFQRVRINKEKDLLSLEKQGYGYVCRIKLLNMRTQDEIPYMSVSKRIADFGQVNYEGEAFRHDNGRCLFEGGWSEMAMTNVDWEIMRDHYEYDAFECIECYSVRMGPLPKPIRETISDYFLNKTKLKGIDGQEYFYTKSKNKLNGIYGMMVMALLRDGFYLDEEWKCEKAEITDESLEKYYKKRTSFLHYQWGVWVTAYARRRLQKAIDICGNYIVYCDTDSVKFRYHPDIVKALEGLNKSIQSEADSCETAASAYTQAGELQTLGLWDKDAKYDEFITYGAKKYAYVKAGKFSFTVSGLGKAAKGELRTMEDFVLGKVIQNSGRTISEYDDETALHPIKVEGRTYWIRSNMAILNTTYTLGVTDEYLDLVDILGETYEATRIDGKRVLKFKSAKSYDPD